MKLELKHLAPYLPYELKCKLKDQGKETIGKLSGCYSDNSYAFFDTVESEHGFEDIKPMLRPLSDLGIEDAKAHNYPDEGHLERSLLSGHAPYKVWIEFVKEHFDVFGLIEKGLAIDISTIEND